MTLWDLLKACLRLWPVVVVGALVTALAGWAVTLDRGVYWARTQVVFLAPSSVANPNALNTRSGDLIITAGIVAKRVMGAEKITKFAAPEVTIVGGTSVRDGFWVRLPDTGGQWATNFASQELVVEAVGSTPERVTELQQFAIGRIKEELAAMQAEQRVDPENYITVTVVQDPAVTYQIKGSRPRALLMTAVLGIAFTLAVVATLDLRETRRRRRAEPDRSPASS